MYFQKILTYGYYQRLGVKAMFIAIDENGNRVYAEEAVKNQNFYCQCCNEKVILKQGSIKRWHFSHKQDTNCKYANDKDYKTEWHIRMQNYFPKESQEYKFHDDVNNEIHIADVYLKEDNIVLEFQHSPISKEEFLSRTIFHIKNGRKIAWFFDESDKNPEKVFGKFIKDPSVACNERYRRRAFKWKHLARRELICSFFNNVREYGEQCRSVFRVFVFLGTEGDVFHRIEWMNAQGAVNFSLLDMDIIEAVEKPNLLFVTDNELCKPIAKKQAIPRYYIIAQSNGGRKNKRNFRM